MAIKTIPNITSSLNLGLLYNFSYRFQPQEGVKISLYFINTDGIYNTSFLNVNFPVTVNIASNQFKMYPVSYKISESAARKVIRVDLIDSTFLLENYYIVLNGTACGDGLAIYPLGTPVNQNQQPSNQDEINLAAIKSFTQFPDVEYTFFDFVNTLRIKFPVVANVPINNIVSKNFAGSFKEVLNAWCSFYGLVYFFENNVIQIHSASSLNITLPEKPTDTIEYNVSESLENTFSKTACVNFAAEGGQVSINGTGSNTADITTTITLYPVGSQYGDPATPVDPAQLVAAAYGEKYWFLYNFFNAVNTSGTDANGFTDVPAVGYRYINASSLPSEAAVVQTMNVISNHYYGNNQIAAGSLDNNAFSQNYGFYQGYGQKIAGRYYETDALNDANSYLRYTFVDDQGQRVKLDVFNSSTPNAPSGQINPVQQTAFIEGTNINSYSGLPSYGSRLIYYDSYPLDLSQTFSLSSDDQIFVDSLFTTITQGLVGGRGLDFSLAFPSNITGLTDLIPFNIPDYPQGLFDRVDDAVKSQVAFFPRFSTLAFNGKLTTSLSNPQPQNLGLQSQSATTSLIPPPVSVGLFQPGSVFNPSLGNRNNVFNSPSVPAQLNNAPQVTNGILTTEQKGQYVSYYPKYSQCQYYMQGVGQNVLKHEIKIKQFSVDIPVKTNVGVNGNVTSVTRDFSALQLIPWSEMLMAMSEARTFTTKSVEFTLNYFYTLPALFISNGLDEMSIEVQENGITATYSFSNRVLQVPQYNAFIELLEMNIKNSYKRQYRPPIFSTQ